MLIVETDVVVTTADGACDAAFFHPETGSHPGVLFWADGFGLRPVIRDIARRLAAEGYSVLVPNPFYRAAKAPVMETPFDFSNTENRTKLFALIGTVSAEGAAESDAAAYLAFLDAQPQVDHSKKLGTHGYCMGGALAFRTAALFPDRFGALGSFHGGGLVTDKPGSPHLLVPRLKARVYVGVAANDDEKQPEAKDVLKAAFAASGVAAEVELIPALHGWCMSDMPLQNGEPIFSQPEAEHSFRKLTALYQAALG